MSTHHEERAEFYSGLSSWVIESLGSELRATRKALADSKSLPTFNTVGRDIDIEELQAIERIFSGENVGLSAEREAQLRELAFWRWVAFEGYAGSDPRAFPFLQEHLMVSTFYRTGWMRSDFLGKCIIELGCGPLGMIEYLPANDRIAFDPLNRQYDRLFSHYRSDNIQYLSNPEDFDAVNLSADLVICHNVLDQTSDPSDAFNRLFEKLKLGGQFLIQVNLSRDGVAYADEHRRTRPAPITLHQISDWLSGQSIDFEHSLGSEPTDTGETYFLAWGTKTKSNVVSYAKQII